MRLILLMIIKLEYIFFLFVFLINMLQDYTIQTYVRNMLYQK